MHIFITIQFKIVLKTFVFYSEHKSGSLIEKSLTILKSSHVFILFVLKMQL